MNTWCQMCKLRNAVFDVKIFTCSRVVEYELCKKCTEQYRSSQETADKVVIIPMFIFQRTENICIKLDQFGSGTELAIPCVALEYGEHDISVESDYVPNESSLK